MHIKFECDENQRLCTITVDGAITRLMGHFLDTDGYWILSDSRILNSNTGLSANVEEIKKRFVLNGYLKDRQNTSTYLTFVCLSPIDSLSDAIQLVAGTSNIDVPSDEILKQNRLWEIEYDPLSVDHPSSQARNPADTLDTVKVSVSVCKNVVEESEDDDLIYGPDPFDSSIADDMNMRPPLEINEERLSIVNPRSNLQELYRQWATKNLRNKNRSNKSDDSNDDEYILSHYTLREIVMNDIDS